MKQDTILSIFRCCYVWSISILSSFNNQLPFVVQVVRAEEAPRGVAVTRKTGRFVTAARATTTTNTDPGLLFQQPSQQCVENNHRWGILNCLRGGGGGVAATATSTSVRRKSSRPSSFDDVSEDDRSYAYVLLARAMQPHLNKNEDGTSVASVPPSVDDLVKAFKMMSSSQKAFKGLDGAAHEAYQRTHTSDDIDLHVTGRARRSLSRASAAADGLGACELCELVEFPERFTDIMLEQQVMQQQQQHLQNETMLENDIGDGDRDAVTCESLNGTTTVTINKTATTTHVLTGREILLNVTDAVQLSDQTNLSVVVLYESSYQGGAGINHGGILAFPETDQQQQQPKVMATTAPQSKGRLLIILGDRANQKLDQTMRVLVRSPTHVRLKQGLATSESASVQANLYAAAGKIVHIVEPFLREYSEAAIHFVGHSLSGGVSALAATILDGRIAMPGDQKKKKKLKRNIVVQVADEMDVDKVTDSKNVTTAIRDGANATVAVDLPPLQGLARGRVSAVTLGAPPSMSGNVQADYITSILFGDDIICRTSNVGIDRFLSRTRRALKSKGVFLRQMNWMTDTFSLATSNLMTHAHGSEGEEARLCVPGRAYLIRPRRLGHACSMHEVGGQLKGGREALRAAVLWQINDILLSRSMWKHHQLESYIQGLDRVHLRGFDDDDDDPDAEAEHLY